MLFVAVVVVGEEGGGGGVVVECTDNMHGHKARMGVIARERVRKKGCALFHAKHGHLDHQLLCITTATVSK